MEIEEDTFGIQQMKNRRGRFFISNLSRFLSLSCFSHPLFILFLNGIEDTLPQTPKFLLFHHFPTIPDKVFFFFS